MPVLAFEIVAAVTAVVVVTATAPEGEAVVAVIGTPCGGSLMYHPFTTCPVFRATEVVDWLHFKKSEASLPDLKILVIALFSVLVSITGCQFLTCGAAACWAPSDWLEFATLGFFALQWLTGFEVCSDRVLRLVDDADAAC